MNPEERRYAPAPLKFHCRGKGEDEGYNPPEREKTGNNS